VLDERLTRRSLVTSTGTVGLLALVAPGHVRALIDEVARSAGDGRFLTARELRTLRAVTARLVPGPPDDPDPGALEARCAEAIDLLLGAFRVKPALIHAGGPFSGRAGGGHDDFAHFVAPDRHAALGWRIRLEGSRGMKAREFAGPVRGLQQVYREGLAHLDARAGGDFAALPGLAQDALLSDVTDAQLQELVNTALDDTLEAMYGPPEYGGNHGLVGWSYTHWAGDRQPRGFSDREVSEPGGAARLSLRYAQAAARFLERR
jgi:hypothetical protein